MRIYLVRHGQTDWNTEMRAQGRKDVPLNATGRTQAEKLRESIKDLEFDAVYASPLRRAAETAEIAMGDKYEILYDDRLVERSFGDFEGKILESWAQPVKGINIDDMTLEEITGNVETVKSMLARVRDFVDFLKQEYSDDAKILVVALATAQEIAAKIVAEFDGEVEFVFYHDAKEWQEPDCDVTKLRCWTRDVATATIICDKVNAEFGDKVQGFVARTAVMTNVVEWVDNPDEYRSFVDVMSVEAGKYNAVKRLSEGLPNEKIVTVGDGTNDLKMIQGFDGYAMRDSVPEVLEVVRLEHIIGSVGELLGKL